MRAFPLLLSLALSGALSGFALAPLAAQPAAMTPSQRGTPAPKPVDLAFAAAEKAFLALEPEARKAIQRDLIWVAKFPGSATGDFGPLTFSALKRFETEAKQKPDAILSAQERDILARIAEAQRKAAKFDIMTEKGTGMRVGVPGVMFTKTAPNASGGTRYQDQAEKVTLETIVYKKEDTLADLFEKGTSDKVRGRKITYKLLRPEFFVISGETAGGKFYRRVETDGKGALRGLSLGYDRAVAAGVERYLIAIAASFEPFPKAAAPEGRPGPAAVAEAGPRQRRATGITVGQGVILTSEAALKGCAAIAVDGGEKGGKKPVQVTRRVDSAGILVLSGGPAAAGPGIAAPKEGVAVLVQRDEDGEISASAASIAGSRVRASLQEGGAGAALFDRSGALVGVIAAAPVVRFKVAGIVPALTYPFLPAAEVAGQAGVNLRAAAPGGEMTSAAVAEAARPNLVALVCVSDK